MVHKLQKTFGLSVLLKLAGIKTSDIEQDGYLLIKNLKRVENAVSVAIEKYKIKFRVR